CDRARLPVLQLRRCDAANMSSVKFGYDAFDLSGGKTYPLGERHSKARREDFGRPWDPRSGFRRWLASLPNALAAADFRAVVAAMGPAPHDQRGIVWGIGA